MTGRHTGDWFGTPATGRKVSITGTDIVRVPDDKITEIRHVEELQQLQQQLVG
jgi:predicted ester cyclase